MYTRMLIPLDESKVAEQVLPYARCLAKALAIPVELLELIDPEVLNVLAKPEEGRYIDTLVDEKTQTSKSYLQRSRDRLRESTSITQWRTAKRKK